jgi:uncharacterized protein (TIRG00374 family)
MIHFLKRIWQRPAARILMSICLLVILLANLPLQDLWHTVRQVSPYLWAFIVAAFISGHVIGVIKWRLLINIGKRKLLFPGAIRCYFAGLFANLFLPSLAGGDIVRAGLAIQVTKEKEAVILGSLVDRFLDMNALVLFILIGVLYSPASITTADYRILLWVFFIILGFAFVFLIFLLVPLPRSIPKRLRAIAERIQNGIKHLIRNPQRAVISFFLAMSIQGGFVLLNAILGAACDIHLPLHIWFISWPLAKLFAMLPVSMGGFGLREVALAVILSRFEVPFSSSVGLGLLWETVIVAGGGMGGIFYFLARKNHSGTDSGVVKEISAGDKTARLFDNPD